MLYVGLVDLLDGNLDLALSVVDRDFVALFYLSFDDLECNFVDDEFVNHAF